METMNVQFPNGEEVELEFGKPIVVIGANGTGKTRFSAKIEELNDPAFKNNQLSKSHIHRLSAQKSLAIDQKIAIFDHDSSEKNLFLGNTEYYAYKEAFRFQNNPVTGLLNDFQYVLSLFFSEAQKEIETEHKAIMKCQEEKKPIGKLKETVIDRAEKIWNALLPHRTIDLSGNGVHVTYKENTYHGKEMSDGERVMLYMICQALVIKPNSLFIIDEPELHIHKAIVNELWTMLENERPDCIFMYLTHDIDFALSRNSPEYIWVKAFDGNTWEYESLDVDSYPDLPNDLLFEILGTRQKIVFVEGSNSSFDYKLYQEIYRDKGYHVIPCGGCQDVIRLVKAKKAYEKLQSIEVYGIIDRDFRTEREIDSLKDDGIFALNVAEVENLFVVPEILEIMEAQLGCDEGTADIAKQFITDLYNAVKNQQIAEALSKEISYQLSLFDIGKQPYTNEDIKTFIDEKYSVENIGRWRAEKEEIFNSANSLTEILRVFNYKDLSRKVGSKFNLADRDFPKRVINVLTKNRESRSAMLQAISQYVPELP